MKRLVQIFLVLICFYSVNAKVLFAEGPELKAVKEVWDFGKIVKGDVKEKAFSIINTGDESLEIDEIKACCGYKVADVGKWVLAPGERTEIKVTSDTRRKTTGNDAKKITIISNDSKFAERKITVTSQVIAGDIKDNSYHRIMVNNISADKLKKYIVKGKKILILDVREKSEFSEKHIPGAINFPRSQIKDIDIVLKERLKDVDKDTMICVNCGSGIRSSYVARKISDLGYKAFNLEGGFMARRKKGIDVITGPGAPLSVKPLEIGLQEAYDHYYLIFKDKVVWVDVRDGSDFEKGHIPGAINIEISDLRDAIKSLPKDKEIVLYCYGSECDEAEAAGTILIENGFKQGKIKVFTDGYSNWEAAGYPVKK